MKSMMGRKESIDICVCTFKRQAMLDHLLSKLTELETEGLFSYSIVIVDNDRAESARKVVERWMSQSEISISYKVEPEQNIARARNKAVENAHGKYIGFIDDDEFPDPKWLITLYKALHAHQSDGVLGPVLPYFQSKPPTWVIRGHFFSRPTHQTGDILAWTNTRTGNVLFNNKVFDKNQLWFDPNFGSGGEDRNFFRKKMSEGYIFTWCNEAPVFEIILPRRWNRKVLLQRALLRGKMALNFAKSKPISVCRSFAAILVYLLLMPFCFVFGYHYFMRYLVKTFDHIGKVFSYMGFDIVKEKYITG
jgi:glycosyltransferase involved in cell wall biosynthesis